MLVGVGIGTIRGSQGGVSICTPGTGTGTRRCSHGPSNVSATHMSCPDATQNRPSAPGTRMTRRSSVCGSRYGPTNPSPPVPRYA
jgi:hypothetical protein